MGLDAGSEEISLSLHWKVYERGWGRLALGSQLATGLNKERGVLWLLLEDLVQLFDPAVPRPGLPSF
jgi:hypothetical protein